MSRGHRGRKKRQLMKLYHEFKGDWDQPSLGITRKTSWENVDLSLAIKGSNGEKMKIAYYADRPSSEGGGDVQEAVSYNGYELWSLMYSSCVTLRKLFCPIEPQFSLL